MSGINSSYASFEPDEKREYIRNYVQGNPFPRTFEGGHVPSIELITRRIYNCVKSISPDRTEIVIYIGDIVFASDFALATNQVVERISRAGNINNGIDRALHEIWKNFWISFRGSINTALERIDEDYTVQLLQSPEQNKLF